MLIHGVVQTGGSMDALFDVWNHQTVVSVCSEKWKPIDQNPWYSNLGSDQIVIRSRPPVYHMDQIEQSIFQDALFASARLIEE